MTKEIAKNANYAIVIDETKNRVYLTISGFWRNAQAVENYIPDWQKTVKLLKPGFTLLTDLSTMVTHPTEVTHIHRQAQELITEKGLRFTAEIKPKDPVTAFQLAKVAQKSQMPVKQFASFADAEAYLDSLV
jgi:hypothetical protein